MGKGTLAQSRGRAEVRKGEGKGSWLVCRIVWGGTYSAVSCVVWGVCLWPPLCRWEHLCPRLLHRWEFWGFDLRAVCPALYVSLSHPFSRKEHGVHLWGPVSASDSVSFEGLWGLVPSSGTRTAPHSLPMCWGPHGHASPGGVGTRSLSLSSSPWVFPGFFQCRVPACLHPCPGPGPLP